MEKLDSIVIGEVSRRILEPERLKELLEGYLKSALDRDERQRDQLKTLRTAHSEAEAGLTRLLALVEQGLMDVADAALRERMVGLRFRRDELAREISGLARRLAAAEPSITPAKVEAVAKILRKQLHDGPGDLRQAYARLILNEVRVMPGEIRISGSKAILARTAAKGENPDAETSAPQVLSFVRQWCTRQDSNL